MPTKKTGTTPANQQKGKKVCTCCHHEKRLVDGFYISKSPLFSIDGRLPVCKDCIADMCVDSDTGEINEVELNKCLRKFDKPYYKNDLMSAYEQFEREHAFIDKENIKKYGRDIIKLYFKNISMRQCINKSYEDSEKDGFIHQNTNTVKSKIKKIDTIFADVNNPSLVIEDNENNECKNPTSAFQKKEEPVILANDDNFKVTPEIIDLFGEGYTTSMYKKMQEKYDKLKINYTLQTNIHQEALAPYVRFKVQEELATARGDVTEAKKWYDAAQSSAQDAKLTPKQLTKADLDSGVTSMSELTKALEQAVDVIKILPRFKYRPNDAVDFNIWCYVNYERRLNGQPEVAYEDVYKFYDEKKKQYIEQNGDPYGIFSNDTTEKNRDTVKTFIKLPDDYDDLGGEDNENT